MTRLIRWSLVAILLGIPFGAEGQGSIVNAVSCSVAAVQTAINAAVDGGTVVIPACPGGISWTTTLTVTKGITIQGGGIGTTVLLDNVSKGDSACANANPMLVFDVAAPKRWRLTGLTIRGSAPDVSVCSAGHLFVRGTSKAWRLDHVRLENQQTIGIRISGDTYGVIDHNQFHGTFKQGILVEHSGWGGRAYGDGSWAEPLTLGTEKAVYIEDNVFTDPSPVGAGAVDATGGARYVFRYNQATFMGNHGTESSGRRRSVRSYEIYHNTFNAGSLAAVYTAINLRGGTGVVFNNTFIGDYNAIINVQNFRDTGAYSPWGQCDGSSPYDQNQAGQTGYACIDQIGRSTGALLSGDTPTPAAWPNQALEPLYQWGNTRNGVVNPTISAGGHIRANRDYVDNVAKPGYTPYPYPHPLTFSGPPPSTPADVTVR